MPTAATTTRPALRRPARRRLAVGASALAATLALAGCLSAGQTQDMDLVNQARKANRKATVVVDDPAMTKAQGWSDHMAGTGVLEHTGGGSKLDTRGLTNWCSVAENVGVGPSVQAVHDAFLASSVHKANMLGNYQRIGTGVTTKGSRVWMTEIYLRAC